MHRHPHRQTVLLTGATGYVGGRLLPRLVGAGYPVRCLARRPEALRPRVPQGVEVVVGDVLDGPALAHALGGVRTAVYLIHSMGEAAGFAEHDRKAALAFGDAARAAGVGRIVYLGGLGDDADDLSEHLRSRHEVGRALRVSGVPVVELRASVILGAGSLSFELIRALVERLPVMVTPRWVHVPTQPIWIGDVIEALLWAIRLDPARQGTFDIGGPEVVSYADLMLEYARQRGLSRWMIPVPFLTPRLSSLWLALVTPVYARVGRALIDGIRHPTVVRPGAAPVGLAVRPVGVAEAIARTLAAEDAERRNERWADGTWLSARAPRWEEARLGNRLMDARAATSAADPARLFAAVERIGGRNGWHAGAFLWRLRGWLDLLAGGVGMRRGRRDPERLAVGDVLDCWRVEEIEPGRRLLLRAEMMLPGRAWLEFVVEPGPGERGSVLLQTATFDPIGLAGLAYWRALWPVHNWVFAGMVRGLVRSAEAPGAATNPRLPAAPRA
jgi:uncharacterized protein YbjT (DUF2867 family)